MAEEWSTADWLRHVAEYPMSLGMSEARDAMERGDLGGVCRALARKAERDKRLFSGVRHAE